MKKTIKKILVSIFLFTASHILAQDSLVCHWTFDDPNDLTKATTGNNLILIGNHQAVAGPESENGAVHIGVGSYYIAAHGMDASGGGNRVNEFTLVVDIKVPQLNRWYCMYQSNQSNTNDGEWFINPSGMIGVGATGYTHSLIEPNEWYRLAVSVKNGFRYDYYVDGQLATVGSPGSVDGRFSWGITTLLFADENGEDNPLDVAEIKIFSKALTNEEIASLGGYGHSIVDEPTTSFHTYLQSPTPTSIYVCWHDFRDISSHIEYGSTEALGNSLAGTTHKFNNYYIWHWAKLTGLQPETTYYYKIVTDTMETEIKRFKTQPNNAAEKGHVRFTVIGDNRTDIDRHAWVIEKMKEKMTELYGDNIEDSLNCVLNVGDIVTNGNNLSEYKAEYFDPVAPISGAVPFMISIGNHENEAQYFYDYMKYEDFDGAEGEKYFSFIIGRVLFVSINSNWQLRNATQLTWLDNLLNDAQHNDNIDWIFTFCHHPGRSELWPDGNTHYVQNQIIPILKKYAKVDMLMYGHSHNYERGAVQEGNVRLLLSGGGGSALDRWGMYGNQTNYPEIQRSFDHYCYVLFDVDIENKKYTATTYSMGHLDKLLDNVIIDQFTRDKADQTPPNNPVLVAPDSGAVVDFPIVLQASTFSGKGEIMSSHFQLSTSQGNYTGLLVNSIRDFEDLYYDTGPPNFESINLNEDIDLTALSLDNSNLEDGKQYWWRVRYRDKNLQWSDWSKENSFTFGTSSQVAIEQGLKIKTNTLHANYPNPFNNYTRISFEITDRTMLQLTIFDVKGRIVKRLVNGYTNSGYHQLLWDGSDEAGKIVSSGLYIIRLESSDFSQVRRAFFLK